MDIKKKMALSIILSAALVACGGGGGSESSSGNNQNPTETPFTPKKLSEWEHSIVDGDAVYLQRDDGTLWKWQLVAAGKPQKIDTAGDSVKSLQAHVNVSGAVISNIIVILTQTGNAFQVKSDGSLTLLATGIKQISENLYLQTDGIVRDWSHNVIPEMPKMSRLLESDWRYDGADFAKAGIGQDGQLYLFKGIKDELTQSHISGVSKVGAYPEAQAVLPVETAGEEWVAAVLQGSNKWLILDKAGKTISQQLFSGVANTRGIASHTATSPGPTAIAGDGKAWKWSDAQNGFLIQSECFGVEKILPSGLLFMTNGSFRDYKVNDTYCQEQSSTHLKDVVVKDALGNWNTVVGIKSDGSLIASVRKFEGVSMVFATFPAEKPL